MTSVQTQIFENGEWVTQTLTAEELMGTNLRSPPAAREPLGNAPKAPKHGLLTRTIIDSPIIRWVHPAQLRSSRYNDVALVGVRIPCLLPTFRLSGGGSADSIRINLSKYVSLEQT
jgi:hypothetical protein